MTNSSNDGAADGVDKAFSRRDALKRGALVGGAAVWAVPAVQALSMTAAAAEKPSPTDPPPDPSPSTSVPPSPPAPRTGKVPSHGIFVVIVGTKKYGIKIDGSTFDKIASPSDTAFMQAKGFTYSDPSVSVLALFAGNGGPTPDGEHGTFVTIPAGATLVAGSAFAFDGGLQKCGNGDKYQAGVVGGGQIVFYGACHE